MTALADHPVAWCKDYKGGRSFYTGVGDTRRRSPTRDVREHLAARSSGRPARPTRSTATAARPCSPTTSRPRSRRRRTSTSRSASTQLPDGRVIQTARGGQLRLHDPATAARRSSRTLPVYTNSEDGLYGPAVDNDFATNKWVYLYYAPPTVATSSSRDGTTADVTTPPTARRPTVGRRPVRLRTRGVGYFQLSRFKFVDGATPSLDLAREQKIMRVPNNRGACCHVARRHRLRQAQQPVAGHG